MRTWLVAALAAIALAAGFLVDPQRALFAYLAAFALVTSVLLGALTLAMIGRLTENRWYATTRPQTEALVATIPLLAVLFLPVAFGLWRLYPWAHFATPKGAFLTPGFFLLRSAFYLGTWAILALLLPRAPREVSAAGLPLVALTGTFAAFDWFMSLEPEWFSAIYGVYLWSGGFLAALALVVLLGAWNDALGKLLLTASIFWAYIAYSQALIIWIAGKPIENGWYAHRTHDGWGPLLLAFVAAKFVVPLFALLPYDTKRHRGVVLAVSALILLGHALDIHWLILPARLAALAPSWIDAAALVALPALLLGAASTTSREVAYA